MPGQFCDAFVELFGIGRRELADRLQHTQRRAEVETAPQRRLPLAREAHSALPGPDALRAQIEKLALEHRLRAARTSRVPGAEHGGAL